MLLQQLVLLIARPGLELSRISLRWRIVSAVRNSIAALAPQAIYRAARETAEDDASRGT